MRFSTDITLTGPTRRPVQLLADQAYDDHASIHDDSMAASIGLTGAPIEGPTHFSQFDPLAFLVWDRAWFESGCISAHFQTMVVEGEEVAASLTAGPTAPARIGAHKPDGSSVLTGTASIGPDHGETELDRRLAKLGDPGELFIVDQLELGMRQEAPATSVSFDERNGRLYPFSLAEKLSRITEPHPWYTADGAQSSPWNRPILPMEMISVLAHKAGADWPVRSPSVALFLDLEIRILNGPVFVGVDYACSREIVGLGQSRRTESYWTRTTLADADGAPVAQVLLHTGVFKESFAGYPPERLGADGR